MSAAGPRPENATEREISKRNNMPVMRGASGLSYVWEAWAATSEGMGLERAR